MKSFLSARPDGTLNDIPGYVIDVKIDVMDDEKPDGLLVVFNAALLRRFRFIDTGNLLSV